jgi:hypothetical protein
MVSDSPFFPIDFEWHSMFHSIVANICNSTTNNVNMIAEMGITPEVSFREKKPSIRTVAFAIISTIRMQKMKQEWDQHKKIHESLVKKLESMKRGQRRSDGTAARR